MDGPFAIDGSNGELAVRRVVVWRRLEVGDERTPGTEIAPEAEHVEAKVLEIGLAPELLEELADLWAVKDRLAGSPNDYSRRYEPAGVLFAIGGGIAVGELLEFLPAFLMPFGLSLAGLGVAVGLFTRARKHRSDREADKRWKSAKEREALERIEKRLARRWASFVEQLRDEHGFRTEIRVGDVHEAERLVSIPKDRLSHPDTWAPDRADDEVRYSWVYTDGRAAEQVAVIEDAYSAVEDAAKESSSEEE